MHSSCDDRAGRPSALASAQLLGGWSCTGALECTSQCTGQPRSVVARGVHRCLLVHKCIIASTALLPPPTFVCYFSQRERKRPATQGTGTGAVVSALSLSLLPLCFYCHPTPANLRLFLLLEKERTASHAGDRDRRCGTCSSNPQSFYSLKCTHVQS